METAIFWIAWGIISFWALKTFYYSFSKEKLEHLRKAAFGINFAVLILIFLPWLPGKTGLALALEGNFTSILFVILLLTSAILFLSKNTSFLKLASAATIANTILLFVIMHTLRPGTFVLTFYDIAPVIAALLLLLGDIGGLLLWRQLELKIKGRK